MKKSSQGKCCCSCENTFLSVFFLVHCDNLLCLRSCCRPLPQEEMKNIIFNVFGEDMSTGVVTQVKYTVIFMHDTSSISYRILLLIQIPLLSQLRQESGQSTRRHWLAFKLCRLLTLVDLTNTHAIVLFMTRSCWYTLEFLLELNRPCLTRC